MVLRAASGASGGTQVIILGLDTAGQSGSVALVDETQILASFYLRQAPTLSSHLLRIIDLVCGQMGCRLDDLEGLAVSLGPGGFTSLRVGLATAQGLAMATGKPLVGCSAFEALVAFAEGWNGAICPVLEARRGEVYAAFYQRQGSAMHETIPGMVTTPDRLFRMERLEAGAATMRALCALLNRASSRPPKPPICAITPSCFNFRSVR